MPIQMPLTESEWTVTDTGIPDTETIDRLGNSFLLGNGFFGYRGTLEEYSKQQKTAAIISGLYDKVGNLWREPVNLPNGGFCQVLYKGVPLSAHASLVKSHSQSINIRHGVHERRTVFEVEDDFRITVVSKRFVSAARLPLLCILFSVEADRDCDLTLLSGIDGDVWDLNGPHLIDIQPISATGTIALTAMAQESRTRIAVCERELPEDPAPIIESDAMRVQRRIRVHLRVGLSHTLTKLVALHTGLDCEDPVSAGTQDCEAASRLGFEALLDEHCAVWEARWARCEVHIDGDPAAQFALRFSMYHLLAIAPAHSASVSIPARGLSGQVYKGGVFWDTEIFMLPFFCYSFPEIARHLIQYRFHTLGGARRKAREYGYRGAFYAWESQESGDDACTLFNITDVFTNRPMRTYFRDKQIHISADIAFAVWNYYAISGDASVLLEGGAEVVLECARFFLSCAYAHPEAERYEFLDVTGPDEYHERVNNNAYTNWMAAEALDICRRVRRVMLQNHPQALETLIEKLDIQRDLASIDLLAERIDQPAPDPLTKIIPQFDGYHSLENVPLDALMQRKLNPREYLGGANGIAAQTQIIKQADVMLAMCLLPDRQPRDVLQANWEHYEPRTEQGSSLSACSYAISATQIGNLEAAYRFFMDTALIDLTGDAKQYVGTLYIGGTHPAANGGAWMTMAYGFCGLHLRGTTLIFHPHLPHTWNEIRLPLHVQGYRLDIAITHDWISLHVSIEGRVPLVVSVDDKTHPLPHEGTMIIAYREGGMES
jgi:nigerose phosphorylase